MNIQLHNHTSEMMRSKALHCIALYWVAFFYDVSGGDAHEIKKSSVSVYQALIQQIIEHVRQHPCATFDVAEPLAVSQSFPLSCNRSPNYHLEAQRWTVSYSAKLQR